MTAGLGRETTGRAHDRRRAGADRGRARRSAVSHRPPAGRPPGHAPAVRGRRKEPFVIGPGHRDQRAADDLPGDDDSELRLTGWASRTATAEGGGRAWQFMYRGMWQPRIQAVDVAGTADGEYKGRTPQLGGALQWSDRELALRPDSLWHDRYVLSESDRRLATIERRAWAGGR